MKNYLNTSMMLLITLAVIISGCRKNDTDELESATEVSRDNAASQNVTDDVLQQVDDAAMRSADIDPLTSLSPSGTCPTISIITTNGSWPKTVIIDYGNTNCSANGNTLRRGKIIANFTGPYRQVATIVTIGFDNYFVNNNKVTGTKTITNLGNNSSGQMQWTVNVQQAKITRPDSSFITWDATRLRTWVTGQNTLNNRNDDAFEIMGTTTGSNSNGHSFISTVTVPLYVAWGCDYIQAGTLDFTPSGKPTRTINFGTAGVCDNQATLTVNGNTYNITLKP